MRWGVERRGEFGLMGGWERRGVGGEDGWERKRKRGLRGGCIFWRGEQETKEKKRNITKCSFEESTISRHAHRIPQREVFFCMEIPSDSHIDKTIDIYMNEALTSQLEESKRVHSRSRRRYF